jgi:mono/diheme cytochrome c family protein
VKRAFLFALAGAATIFFLGCQAAMVNPAPLDADVIRRGSRMRVSETTLREGRRLFTSRCIECHTLPVAWHYADAEWPRLVHDMSRRSSLKDNEEQAIVAYIRAIRAQ